MGVIFHLNGNNTHYDTPYDSDEGDLTEEEIEYDYLQRMKEKQDEEDCYLQQQEED